jgi:tetratricopeptide (TPR) repeat protein
MVLQGTSRAPRFVLIVATSLLCTFSVARAHASPDGSGQHTSVISSVTSADKKRAAELFKKGADAYRQGDFQHAIELLDEAYALDPQPVLVYNRARAAEGLGNLDEAIAGYEKFLSQEPNAPDRGAIEQRLVTLRKQRDDRAALEKERATRNEAPPAPVPVAPAPASESSESTPPPSPPPRHSRSVAPYVVAGVGVVGIGAGAVFGVLALSKKDSAVSEPIQQKSMDLKDSADSLATVSTVSFIAGGVLLAVGATWWLLDGGSSSKGKASLRSKVAFSANGLQGTFP